MLEQLTPARVGERVKDVLGFSDGLLLPKQTSSIAPDHVWSNADQDVRTIAANCHASADNGASPYLSSYERGLVGRVRSLEQSPRGGHWRC
jgi:hypothetical protein